SALIKMGGTTIACGFKAEISEPELDSPGLVFIVPNLTVTLPAICSPEFKPSPPSAEAQVSNKALVRFIVISPCFLRTPSSDTLPLAMVAALDNSVFFQHLPSISVRLGAFVISTLLKYVPPTLCLATLPNATFDPSTPPTTCSRTVRVPLSLDTSPRVPQFRLYWRVGTLRAVPTSFEEPLLSSTISMVVDAEGGMVSVERNVIGDSEGAESPGALDNCALVAKARANILHGLLP
ncbi:hypothetical protein BU15DRAFT_57267, partial [Melanogaster broomeanus]